jgi:regulator of sirC expression with transglutaminase-like and TPR domain
VTFEELAASHEPGLDRLAIAIAAEFREVDGQAVLRRLDELAGELEPALSAEEEGDALAELLGGRHGFAGELASYDDPESSMIDVVLERRTGLPILLSAIYEEVARRRAIDVRGVGLSGHFVVGHFGADPPLLYDPWEGGVRFEPDGESASLVRPWRPQETALRMLNNLVAQFGKHGDVGRAIRAGELRLMLPTELHAYTELEAELRSLRARLN